MTAPTVAPPPPAPSGDEVTGAFEAALAADARAETPPPDLPPPPPRATSTDPEAPHGRDEAGVPLAPFGINKKTRRPNLKPGGPGRGHRGSDKPRETTAGKAPPTAAAARAAPGGPDYSADLTGLGVSVWIGASAIHGGKLPLVGLRVPDLRPYAYVWQDQLPQLVGAWNNAARQNATVRGWVEKLTSDGSWQWVVAVAVSGSNFLAGCTQLARAEPGVRQQYGAANDDRVRAFLAEQLAGAQAAAAAVAAGEPA